MKKEKRDNPNAQVNTDSGWIDISVPLHNGMVHWPGDPPVKIERVMDVASGDSHTMSLISMGSHSGTHLDAPVHFSENGKGIDAMPLDTACGRARIIEIRDSESIKPEELEPYQIRRGERLLFKTINSSKAWKEDTFTEDFVYLSGGAADYLAERGVRLVGIDYLSVGSFRGSGSYVHKRLLDSGIWILEGINLAQTNPGKYELICLPLRITGGDGSPARAILKPVKR